MDQELIQFRSLYYGLLVQLLAREPAPELLSTLRQDIDGRIAAVGEIAPMMAKGWRSIREELPALDAEAAGDEFTQLFLGPFARAVNPYESYYLSGQVFGEPLAEVRGFMGEIGLEKDEARFSEPEDHLAFELEIMNWLARNQLAAKGQDAVGDWQTRQMQFLEHHALVWMPACAQDIEQASQARLYAGVARLLRGFLAFEEKLFQTLGMGEIEPLEKARTRYRQRRDWKGPTFDPTPGGGGGDAPGQG